jgi:hypothetical protein
VCLYGMVLRTRMVLPVLNIVSRNDEKTTIIIHLLKSVAVARNPVTGNNKKRNKI